MTDQAAGVVLPYVLDDELAAATAADGRPRVRVYRPDRVSVVLGRGSRAQTELHLDEVHADGIPLMRRAGGGCSVVLDPGNVIVVAAVPQRGLPHIRRLFAALSAWMLDGLARAGVRGVHREDVSDLALGDRKIGGASLYLPRDAALYGVSLLVEPDVVRMERYLAHPPREPDYRRGRRHADFVGRLADLPEQWTAERLAAALRETLQPPALAAEGGPS
jgi:lipoate-protein ligase A